MGRRRALGTVGLGLMGLTSLAGLAACGETGSGNAAGPGSTSTSTLQGTILVDGSSTVAPISQAVAEEFQAQNRQVRVPVGVSGTGGGLNKFCRMEADIANASRPIKRTESDACAAQNVEYIEIPVAFDGLAVMANPTNDFVGNCISVSELKKLWEPDAENTITRWSQIRDGLPDVPIALYGPGVDSGTYDYFTKAIVGEEGASRGDFTPSEDDNVLVQGVGGDSNALGFFGLAYYEVNKDRLKLLAVDGGAGCVAPTTETVNAGTYQPLSRPIFIYVNRRGADERPEIEAFVRFYLQNAAGLVSSVGYVPLPDRAYKLALERFEARIAGSVFAGGSQIGVSIEELLERSQAGE